MRDKEPLTNWQGIAFLVIVTAWVVIALTLCRGLQLWST